VVGMRSGAQTEETYPDWHERPRRGDAKRRGGLEADPEGAVKY